MHILYVHYGAVELISENRVGLLVLAARRGTINTEEADSLLGHT